MEGFGGEGVELRIKAPLYAPPTPPKTQLPPPPWEYINLPYQKTNDKLGKKKKNKKVKQPTPLIGLQENLFPFKMKKNGL